jgi:hypothetical protein
MTHAYRARDLLTDRRMLVDTIVPPLVFVGLHAWLGLTAAAIGSLVFAVLLVVMRLLRRQRLLHALGGLAGVTLSVAFAVWSGRAENFFLPGILTNVGMTVVCVVSILVRRPFIALAAAGIYRWPLAWYWQDRVRPAYSETTWVWAAMYLAKAAIQWVLVEQGALGWLTVARIASGWPVFAVLLAATYAYVSWRLNQLGAPTVEEWRAHHTL